RVWDAQSGRLVLGPLKGHTDIINCVQFSPDGSSVVSCSHDCTIRFWDVWSLGTSLQERTSTSAVGDGEVTPELSMKNASDLWSLDDDGWVIDSDGRRLVWVPSDLHTCLALPPTRFIISDQGYYQLKTDGWKTGDRWMECYEAQ
ncbi:unnamed protein product, partial [Rhizoctonia solani]